MYMKRGDTYITENGKRRNVFNDKICERAILCPRNKTVHNINEHVMNLLPGEEKEYASENVAIDTLCPEL